MRRLPRPINASNASPRLDWTGLGKLVNESEQRVEWGAKARQRNPPSPSPQTTRSLARSQSRDQSHGNIHHVTASPRQALEQASPRRWSYQGSPPMPTPMSTPMPMRRLMTYDI